MSIIFDIKIFHRNLELLRSMTGLNKRNFCYLLKIENAYRKDFKALGLKMEIGITNNFQGVDKKWLLTEHPEGIRGIKFTPCQNKNVHDHDIITKHPIPPADLLAAAKRVLTSGNIRAAEALEKNILYFDHAVEMEKRLEKVEGRLKYLENVEERLKHIEDKFLHPEGPHGGGSGPDTSALEQSPINKKAQ